MRKEKKNIDSDYTREEHIEGDCYRPILPPGMTGKNPIPPKGGTGARTIELKTMALD